MIIATGARYKSLGLERESYMVGRGVSYCALCDGNFFRGQEVAVVGGGDSALEESLYLAKIVKKVHLIHRRDAFRGAKIYQDKVTAEPKISVIYNSVVTNLLGDVNLTGVMLQDTKMGAQSQLDVDGLFILSVLNLSPAFCRLISRLTRTASSSLTLKCRPTFLVFCRWRYPL